MEVQLFQNKIMKKEYIEIVIKTKKAQLSILEQSQIQFDMAMVTLEKHIKKTFNSTPGEMKEYNNAYTEMEETYRTIMSPLQMEIEDLEQQLKNQ